jgi:hypothetical protein
LLIGLLDTAESKINNMGLFSALSGKIYRFNSINQPIDNGIAAKIKGLEDTPERFLLIAAFGITQEMVGQIFHPDHGMFRKSLDSLTAESLAKVYYIVLDLSVSSIIKLPLNIEEKNIIDGLSKVSGQATDKTVEDIASYTRADSGVMKACENTCFALGIKEDSQTAILFGTTFMKIYEVVVDKVGKAIYGN